MAAYKFLTDRILSASSVTAVPRRAASVLSWVAAAGVTTSLHVGAYVAFSRTSSQVVPDVPSFVSAIDIDLDQVTIAPPSDLDNAANGPAQDALEAIEQAQLKPPPPKEPEEKLPELPPTPPDVKSDAQLQEQPKLEQAKEEKKEEPEKEKPREEEKVVRPAVEAGGGPKSNAQAANLALSSPIWKAGVRAKVVRAKRYPAEAEARNLVGSALVGVKIGPKGELEGVELIISSGVASLDQEAVDVMRRAAPYPVPPGGESVFMRIPVSFSRL